MARALARWGWQLLLTGTAADRDVAVEVARRVGGRLRSLVGRLDRDELAAWLAHQPVLIANNTGPVQVAAAVGAPVVDLSARTNPQHTPWGVASRVLFHDVPCAHCYRSVCPEGHHACLRGVAPAAVVEAAEALRAEVAARRSSSVTSSAAPSIRPVATG